MKIAFNVDGVLIDKNKFQYKYGIEYFRRNPGFVNESSYQFRDMFHCGMKEQDDFWKKNMGKYYLKNNNEVGSDIIIKKLKDEGHEIYIIANGKYINAKGVKGDIYRLLLKHWLNSHDIPYNSILYCETIEEKEKVCKDLGIDAIVEDQIHDAIVLSENSNVLMYERPYNIGFMNIDRVNNFYDVYDYLNGKTKKKGRK